MIEFGKTLRSARESKGYTVSQIAEMTHLKSQIVEGLENEDFSMIAAPIYGRGFVKLYCEAVGLEPKPLVDEFMAIMNGEHEIAIKERPGAERPVAESSVVPEPPPPPPSAPASAPVEQDLFRQDPLPPPPAPAVPQPAPQPAPVVQSSPADAEPAFSRFAAPMREYSTPAPAFRLNPRLIILAVAGLALLTLLVFGVRALYCATSSEATDAEPEQDQPTTAETVAPEAIERPAAPKAEARTPAAPRTQQKIPSLYID